MKRARLKTFQLVEILAEMSFFISLCPRKIRKEVKKWEEVEKSDHQYWISIVLIH